MYFECWRRQTREDAGRTRRDATGRLTKPRDKGRHSYVDSSIILPTITSNKNIIFAMAPRSWRNRVVAQPTQPGLANASARLGNGKPATIVSANLSARKTKRDNKLTAWTASSLSATNE